METASLKSLAHNILQRNTIGNYKETIPSIDGNFAGKKEDTRKPENNVNLDKLNILPLEDFKSQNLAVRIRSKVLGEDIWLVSNEGVRDYLKAEGLICYLPEKILKLKGLSAEAIRKVHEVKKVFERSQIAG